MIWFKVELVKKFKHKVSRMKKFRCIFLARALTVSLSGGVPPMPAKSDSV